MSSPSPRSPSMQTPPSVPFRRYRSASLLSREPSASGSLHRVASSTSSSASESLNSVLRHHPPLRRTASELSERPPSSMSRYNSRQPSQSVLSPTPPPSRPSSASERLPRRFGHRVAGASPEPGDAPYPALYSHSRLADSPRSRDDCFMSPDELLAFREFLARRAEDVFTETRNLTISPDSDQRSHDLGDFSEYGDSIPSDRRFSPLGFNKIRGGAGQPGYNPLHLDTTSVTTTLEPLDGGYSKADLLRALSIIRAERARVSSDEESLLTSGDTAALLDLYARSRSSSSMSQRQSSPSLYGNPHAACPERHTSLRSRVTDHRNPVTTASVCIEEMQDFLPDFLDLRPDVDFGGSASNELSSSDSDSSPFFVRDERLASVPEGSAADPSLQRNPMRVEDDRGDPVLAKLPPVDHLSPRRSHSATELDSGRSQYTRTLPPSQSSSQPWNIYSDLLHDGLQHQATSIRTKASAEPTGDIGARHGYDSGTSSLAEFAEMAYSQSVAEPYNRPRGDSYTRRMEGKRTRDGQNRRPGLRIAVDSTSPREFLSRDDGPVFQRQRAMTLQEATASDSSSRGQLHRSASATASISSKSSYTGGRFRTLSDRAYRHPDVPYSPLVSDMDPPMLPRGAPRTAPPAREPYGGHDMDGIQVSSTGTRSAPVVHSGHSPGGAYSRNASPRPSRLRAHMPPSHGRKDSYPIRQRPTQALMRRTGSTPDLRQSSSFAPGLPSSTQGVGLSLVDNGAFEAPRPAPEPRPPQTLDKASILARMVQRGTQAALKKPAADDDARPDSRLGIDMAPTGFGALSFRRPVWSKKQRQEPRSDGVSGHLRSAGSSESGWKSSFISISDDESKPQRKSLFKKKT